MSCRVDTSPLIAGACVVSVYSGLGITGAALRAATATGTHGAGWLYNDWDVGDDAQEFSLLVLSWPSSGTLVVNEDGSGRFTPATDGAFSATYQLRVDGANVGSPVTVTLQSGAGLAPAAITSTLAMGAFTGSMTIAGLASINAATTMGAFTSSMGISTAAQISCVTTLGTFTSQTQIAVTGEPIIGTNAYATAELFIAKFGLAETTQLLEDEERLLTTQLLQDALAGTWTGSPSTADKAAATRALGRLRRGLATASSFMDGYLRAVVLLPLPPGDANASTLEDCCLALTRCGLAEDADNWTERMQAAFDHWHKWLKDIAARRVQLVNAAGEQPPAVRAVRSGQGATRYAWERFGGLN